jgi:hypothetical protein
MMSFPSRSNENQSRPRQGEGTPPRSAELQAANSPDNVVQPLAIPTSKHDAFAQTLGFESYLALFEASTPLKTPRKGQWLLTSLQSQAWVVWNAEDLSLEGRFDSEEAAISALPPVAD